MIARGARPRTSVTSGAMLAGAVCLLALPSAVLAITARFDPDSGPAQGTAALDQIDEGQSLTRAIPIRALAKGKLYPFTPAETPNRPDRSVTVAVRVDAHTARAISVRANRSLAQSLPGTEIRIAPTAFNLGVSRGYGNFGQELVPSPKKGIGDLPDLGQFSIAKKKDAEDSRFSPRIVMDEAQSAGRAPRTYAGGSDDRVDVGGSYRVTENLDVTAGVRYSQERERLLPPLTDAKQDNQAVYVGTQFRF